MNCSKCGFQVNEGDQICSNCGNPLTALSHNEVVMQDIPEKVENPVVNESATTVQTPVFIDTPAQTEPVVPTTPVITEAPAAPVEPVINSEPTVPVTPTIETPITQGEPVTPVTPTEPQGTPIDPVINPTPEGIVAETPLTGTTTTEVPATEPKKKNKLLPIIIFAIALLVVGAGVFIGIKYIGDKTPEPTPIEEEEEEEIEKEETNKKYYPISSLTGTEVIGEYDYYRVLAKDLVVNNYDAFEDKLKAEASVIKIDKSEFDAIYTSYDIKDKKDAITRLNIISYKGDTTIETSMDINVYTEERVNEILKAFVDFYTPYASKTEEYDGYGAYEAGYKLDCINNITMIIGYNKVTENGNTYYTINIIENL